MCVCVCERQTHFSRYDLNLLFNAASRRSHCAVVTHILRATVAVGTSLHNNENNNENKHNNERGREGGEAGRKKQRYRLAKTA